MKFKAKSSGLLHLLLLICMLHTTIGMAAVKPNHIYQWGVVPQFTSLAIHRDWTPIINFMNEHTPYQFKLVLYKSIPDFELAFLAGEPDFAYMNPYHAVMAKHAQGYRPLIRDTKRKLTGILVVRKYSPYLSIQDLQGLSIAFPSPNAFAASLYLRALFAEQEKLHIEPYYAKTHSNAYRQVLLNRHAAAGGVLRTLRKERKEVRDHLRIIYQSPSTPSHPLTAHQRIPHEVSRAVQAGFMQMYANPDLRALLKAILLPVPMLADYQRDYQPLETLKLEDYVVDHTTQKELP